MAQDLWLSTIEYSQFKHSGEERFRVAVDVNTLRATKETFEMFNTCCEVPFAKADVIKCRGSNSGPGKPLLTQTGHSDYCSAYF